MSDAPDAGSPRRLHPATLAARTLKVLPQMAAGGAGYGVVVEEQGLGGVLFFAGIAALIGAGIALLGWLRFTYRVAEREIVIESGILHRQRRVIPFDRVQDISIERGLLARIFGTARVKVETGGSAADEGDLDMIGLADAHALRDRIRRRHGAARADGEAAAPKEEPVLFEMDVPRLFLSGLFNFSLLFLAGIFAVLEYLDNFGLYDWEAAFRPEEAEAAAGMVTLRGFLIGAGLLLLLGIVTGVARTVARDFDFRLTRAEAGLRRRRGLFTLSEVVIPLRRTQVAQIDSGFVARALGWQRLSFQTLGADRSEGGVQVAAPFAREDEILPILAEPGFPPPPPREAFRRAPGRGAVRRAAAPFAGAVLAAAAAFAVDSRAGLIAAALVLLAGAGLLRWRRHRYLLGERALFVTGGLFRRRLWVIPFEKAQAIFVASGPLQRALGLASVLVDTAGASSLGEPEIVDLDAADAERLAARLLALFHEARGRAKRSGGTAGG